MALTTNTKSETAIKKTVLRVQFHFVGDAGNGEPMDLPDCATITFQATGTFSSATYTVQKSNDGVNYVALGTAIAISSAGMHSVAAADLGAAKYRIVVSGGGAGSDVTITVIAHQVN